MIITIDTDRKFYRNKKAYYPATVQVENENPWYHYLFVQHDID